MINFTPQDLKKLKTDLAKHFGYLPKNSQLLSFYYQYLRQKKLPPLPQLEKLLRFRAIRTASGVAPIAIFTQPWPCRHKCLYCPIASNLPESYLPDEPAMQRAIQNQYHPVKQIQQRLDQYQINGHSTAKIELIIMGGTFSYLPKKYRLEFVKQCYQTLNGTKSSSLTLPQLQTQNSSAPHRLVGLSVETRPDCITPSELKFFRQLGVTRVEIGVQSIRNSILRKVNRGHDVQTIIQATKLLKDFGFKVVYHFMPNLPGATPQTDLTDYKKLWSDSRFRPDQIKIYPTLLLKPSGLYQLYLQKKWQPYSQKTLIQLLLQIKLATPPYTRINRLYRDIPAHHVVAGSKLSSMRQHLQQIMPRPCQCIRCRELKKSLPRPPFHFTTTRFKASDCWEYFLQSLDSENKLLGLLRLRIIHNTALIRELHVYGPALPLGSTEPSAPQHQGLGRKLLHRAVKIAQSKSCQQIHVIVSPGIRNYYRQLGFRLGKLGYMIKKISSPIS